jgi:hypothetical protein
MQPRLCCSGLLGWSAHVHTGSAHSTSLGGPCATSSCWHGLNHCPAADYCPAAPRPVAQRHTAKHSSYLTRQMRRICAALPQMAQLLCISHTPRVAAAQHSFLFVAAAATAPTTTHVSTARTPLPSPVAAACRGALGCWNLTRCSVFEASCAHIAQASSSAAPGCCPLLPLLASCHTRHGSQLLQRKGRWHTLPGAVAVPHPLCHAGACCP